MAQKSANKQVKVQKNSGSKYERIVLPKLEVIAGWSRNGVIDKEIAANLGIAYSTFREYVKKYSALSAALKHAKEESDIIVEGALYKKAVGHREIIKKPIKVKNVFYHEETGRKIGESEHIEYADEEIYIPPDTTAAIFWLKNRAPERWADRSENVNVDIQVVDDIE